MGGGKRYCVLCSKHEGQTLDSGEKITFHRIPSGESDDKKKRRALWLQRIRLVRPDAPIGPGTRICSLHFENNMCNRDSVPTKLNLNTPQKVVLPRRPLVRLSTNNREENMDPLDNYQCTSNTTDTQTDMVVMQSVSVQSSSVQLSDIAAQTQGPERRPAVTQTPIPLLKPEDIHGDDEKTRMYTGFPNYGTFFLFFQVFLKHGASKLAYWEGEKRTTKDPVDRKYTSEDKDKPGKKRTLRPLDEFFMVCLRLRLGLTQSFLADLFCVSVMTVSRTMNTWINFMYDHMKSLIPWPSKEQILSNLPSCFAEMSQVRIVIDATEFFCEKPSGLEAQFLTWSEYKHHNTFKVLIGVTPSGLVSFVSRLWGGRASDRHIVQQDGNMHMFLPKLESGDIILADKGFTVGDLLPAHIGLNMPPFVSASQQMTRQEFFKTQQIAAPRIVVEMKMEQIKNFKILQTLLPLSEVHLAEQMIMICCAMTNLYDPLLK